MKFPGAKGTLQLLIIEKLAKVAGYKIDFAKTIRNENGKIGWALLWLVGVPLPLLLVLYFFFGN